MFYDCNHTRLRFFRKERQKSKHLITRQIAVHINFPPVKSKEQIHLKKPLVYFKIKLRYQKNNGQQNPLRKQIRDAYPLIQAIAWYREILCKC